MVTWTSLSPDVAAVRRAVDEVADPELPAVTIGMLGMVHSVTVDGVAVAVELLPTFAGCPATDMIRRDVVTAVEAVAGVERVDVSFRFDPPWTPDRVNEQGRRRLAEFGIAPPAGPAVDVPAGATVLPVATTGTGRTCPWCQGTDTVRDGMFGPTPCRDTWFCHQCRQPFEGFKT